jgi:polyisoprenyl-teichoic acid--peptidoglycan teichoic acid transferase
MRKFLLASLAVMFLLTGCNFPIQPNKAPIPTIIPISDFIMNVGLKYPPTPTPFQPQYISTPPPSESEVPGIGEVTQVPENYGLNIPDARPVGQVNILLLGSDWRPGMGYRTDVIMVVSLFPEQGKVTVTSFPRDLYVFIPGMGEERINVVQAYGGFPLSQAAFQENFDVTLDYYMMTNFAGFQNIIDTLGGVNVYASSTLTDVCALPQAVNKQCTIPAGWNTMNGATALWYVRSRSSSSDFDRLRRAQEVIKAVFTKMMSLDAVGRSAELFDLFISSVETDLALDTIVKLLPLAVKVAGDTSLVESYAIGATETSDYIVPSNGNMVLLPDWALIQEIILKAFYAK